MPLSDDTFKWQDTSLTGNYSVSNFYINRAGYERSKTIGSWNIRDEICEKIEE